MIKRILLLGASGSIGQQTIDVIRQHPDHYVITAVSVGHNVDYLKQFLTDHSVRFVCIADPQKLPALQAQYPKITFFSGDQGLIEITNQNCYDLAVNALQGLVGLKPTLNVIAHGHDVALANKETLVAGGSLVMEKAKENHCHIFPIDSEHSAIWQCLQGNKQSEVKRLIITASGGPFFHCSLEELQKVTLAQALHHPTWTMGAKITIDSATLMNKGFEVIEAHWLFGMPYEKIDVIIHPESVIHSLVEYQDHAVMAQMGVSDMRIPIQYALSYPKRWSNDTHSLDLATLKTLHFEARDDVKFPLLKLAYQSGNKKGNCTAALNGANEQAVAMFRNEEIKYLDIAKAITYAISKCQFIEKPDIDDIMETDRQARQLVLNKEWMEN